MGKLIFQIEEDRGGSCLENKNMFLCDLFMPSSPKTQRAAGFVISGRSKNCPLEQFSLIYKV